MDNKEFEIFKRLTGEKELPPAGSLPRRILDNYGIDYYAKMLRDEKENPGDYNGDIEDPWNYNKK